MRSLLRVLLVPLLACAMPAALAGCFERSLIYFPPSTRAGSAPAGVPEMQPVYRGAAVLAGWYAPARPARPTVVFCHGNASVAFWYADRARHLIEAGYGVFLVEYRGYAGNPGSPTEEGLYEDARAALDWVAARGVPASRIVLWGQSLGTGVAVQMATERPPAALVLEAPYTRLSDLAPAFVPPAVARAIVRDRYDNLSKIASVTAPLLVIHGETDDVVPASMGRRLLEAAPGRTKRGVFLPDGGHADLWRLGAGDAILAFLDEVS